MKFLDQYYTNSDILATIIPVCAKYIKDNSIETFVDFSCGNNEFAHLLSERISGVRYLSYDISPPKFTFKPVIKKNFLTLTSKNLNTCNVACGLNPPYGPGHSLIPKFIRKAQVLFKPKLFFLIIPIASVKSLCKLGLKAIKVTPLPTRAFHTPDGKSFAYPTCFTIMENSSSETDATQKPESVKPIGYEISSGIPLSEAHLLYRTSGRHAGEDIIGKVKTGYVFYRYDGNIEIKKRLQDFKSYRDNEQLKFDSHWIKVLIHAYDIPATDRMIQFLKRMRTEVRDPERNLKSPPSIRKDYIVKFLNIVAKE